MTPIVVSRAMSSDASSTMTAINEEQKSEDKESMIAELFEFSGYNAAELDDAMDAERDVLGSSSQISGVEALSLAEGDLEVKNFHEVMSSMPLEKRQAYEEAVQRSPHTVQLETPARRFLLATKSNIWAAAEKMAAYWELRREVYGEKNFHLPMVLTPGKTTVLSPTARQAVLSGLANLLKEDDYGRPVLLLDRDYVTESIEDIPTRLQMFFFMMHVLSENDSAVRNGFITVAAMETNQTEITKRIKPSSKLYQLTASEIIPVKLRAIHFLLPQQRSPWIQNCLNLWLSIFQQLQFFQTRSRIHYVHNPQTTKQELRHYGLTMEHAPMRFGGDVKFAKWYQSRLQAEETLYGWDEAKPTKISAKVKGSYSKTSFETEKFSRSEEGTFSRDHFQQHQSERSQRIAFSHSMNLAASLKLLNTRFAKKQIFLQAQLNVAHYLINLYDSDRALVRGSLTAALTQTKVYSTWQKHNRHQDDSAFFQSVNEFLLKNCLVIQARQSPDEQQTIRHANGLDSSENEVLQLVVEEVKKCLEYIHARLAKESVPKPGNKSSLEAWTRYSRMQKEENARLRDEYLWRHSKVECAKYLAREYDEDFSRILSLSSKKLLAFLEPQQDDVPSDLLTRADLPRIIGEYFMNHVLLFHGRDPSSGELMFERVGMLLEHNHLALGVDTIVQEVRKADKKRKRLEKRELTMLEDQVNVLKNLNPSLESEETCHDDEDRPILHESLLECSLPAIPLQSAKSHAINLPGDSRLPHLLDQLLENKVMFDEKGQCLFQVQAGEPHNNEKAQPKKTREANRLRALRAKKKRRL